MNESFTQAGQKIAATLEAAKKEFEVDLDIIVDTPECREILNKYMRHFQLPQPLCINFRDEICVTKTVE